MTSLYAVLALIIVAAVFILFSPVLGRFNKED